MRISTLLFLLAYCAHTAWGGCTQGACEYGIAVKDDGGTSVTIRFDDNQTVVEQLRQDFLSNSALRFTGVSSYDACGTENVCGSNSACTNVSDIVYTCSCNTYYEPQQADVSFSCVDADECASGTNNCSASASCTNISPGFRCDCDYGFEGDGVTCTNIDECANSTLNNCNATADCTDNSPNYTCTCWNEYTGDGFDCVDLDECANSATNNCSSNANCTNAAPGFSCQCLDGYSGDGYNCTDIRECDSNPCAQNATCTEPQVNMYNCTCDAGFTGNGTTCVDDDECSRNPGPCHANATCTNFVGGHNCTCNSGFSGDGVNTCTDIDDCVDSNCTTNAQCVDLVNNFTCECVNGWTGDGFTYCNRPPQSICIDFTLVCDSLLYNTDMNDTSSSLYQNVTDALRAAITSFINTVDTSAGFENITYSWINSTDGYGDAESDVTLCINNTQMFENDFLTRVSEISENAECGVTASPDECALGLAGCPSDTVCRDTKYGFCCAQTFDYLFNVTFDGLFNSTFADLTSSPSLALKDEVTQRCSAFFRAKEKRGCVPQISYDSILNFEGSIVAVLRVLLENTTLTMEDITNELARLVNETTSFGTIIRAGDFDECVTDYDSLRNCSALADCLNFAGNFTCNCNESYYDNGTFDGEICITPITVDCDPPNLTVSILMDYYVQRGIDLGELRLADSNCTNQTNAIQIGDSIQFYTGMNDCGTTLSTSADNTTITASNYVTNLPDTGFFTGTEIRIPFQCALPANVSITAGYNGTVNTASPPSIAASGDFRLEMALTDSSFTTKYAYGTSFNSNDLIHMRVEALDSYGNIGIKVDRCWGTPTFDKADSNNVEFISSGCPTGKAQRFSTVANGVGVAKFTFQMFLFRQVNAVYLHCEALVCLPSCAQTCSSRRRRRDVPERETESVILTFKVNLSPNDPLFNNGTIKDVVVFGINGDGNGDLSGSNVHDITLPIVSAILAFVLIVVLALLVIVVVRKKRSTKDGYDMTHVNMHAIGIKPPDY